MYGNEHTVAKAMSNWYSANGEHSDQSTTGSIRQAVAERLGRDLRPDNSELPPRLQTLIQEFRQQER